MDPREPRIVNARRFIRRMQGQGQAHLLRADDGHGYVVKFANNPQCGRRALVNELVASLLFGHVGVCSPECALVRIDEEFREANREVTLMGGNRQVIAIGGGLHYGSMYPGSPERTAVFDCLPDSLLPQVYNRRDFFGALVVDKWLSNADARQALFVYAKLRPPSLDVQGPTWVGQMIDNGYAFEGADWTFRPTPPQGLYARTVVYGPTPTLSDFQPWIEKIIDIRQDTLFDIGRQVPPEWLKGDEAEFRSLLRRLHARRALVPDLVKESLEWLLRKGLTRGPRPETLPTSPPRLQMQMQAMDATHAVGGARSAVGRRC